MVECEYHMILIKGGASPVLIDTWWNVNITEIGIVVESYEF